MNIRHALLTDAPFLLQLARSRYPSFDPDSAEAWLRHCILHDDTVLILRSDNAAIVFEIYSLFYDPQVRRANVRFLAAHPNPNREGFKLFQYVVSLSRANGCRDILFSEETGARFDIWAKKLGATSYERSYILKL